MARLSDVWQDELRGYIRALSGAFLFATPLLWTMEMWWIGQYIDMWKLLLFLALTMGVNTHLAYFAGFREPQERSISASAGQAIDSLAIAIVSSTIILAALSRINPGDPLDSTLGKIVIQAIPLSIGASVANAVLGIYEHRNRASTPDGDLPIRSGWRATVNDVGATAAGAIFIGFSIAPTEEVPKLAAELSHWHELALLALSVLLSYLIVFESGFNIKQKTNVGGAFQRPLPETFLAYFVSLVVATIALYLFEQFTLSTPPGFVLSQILVLGFPATVGGAAGRLVI